ncbi:hypothetical protein I6E24_14425 [Bacteroides caecigallinarum]|nr:hypothetical protein [Bacteroides caecigallinarum]
MRPVERIGAHCKGHNEGSIGICYEGGLDIKGNPKDTRTAEQKHAMKWLIETLKFDFPSCHGCTVVRRVWGNFSFIRLMLQKFSVILCFKDFE